MFPGETGADGEVSAAREAVMKKKGRRMNKDIVRREQSLEAIALEIKRELR